MLPGSRVGDRAVLVHSKGCCAAGCTRLCSITKALQHLQCSCFRLRLVPCTVSVYTLESFNSQDHSQNVCYILLRLQLLPYLLHLPNVSGRTPQSRVSETSWDCCILAYLTLQDKSKRALRESGSQSHKDRVHTQNERNEIRSKLKTEWWNYGPTKLFLGEGKDASLIAQLVKNPPAMQETPVQFLGGADPLEKG